MMRRRRRRRRRRIHTEHVLHPKKEAFGELN